MFSHAAPFDQYHYFIVTKLSSVSPTAEGKKEMRDEGQGKGKQEKCNLLSCGKFCRMSSLGVVTYELKELRLITKAMPKQCYDYQTEVMGRVANLDL
jgi:hypothetical protein